MSNFRFHFSKAIETTLKSHCTKNVRIWSHLPKKSLMEDFIFCAVILPVFMDLAWT